MYTSHQTEQLATSIAQASGFRGHVSKHRQFDPTTGEHIPGNCKIGSDSGLRKLMRAANTGRVPSERIRLIVSARESAAARPEVWLSSHQRRLNAHLQRSVALKARIDELIPTPQPEPATMPSRQFPELASTVEREPVSETAKTMAGIQPGSGGGGSPLRSKTYTVKSNAARAAAQHSLKRSDVFEFEGGYAFNLPVGPH